MIASPAPPETAVGVPNLPRQAERPPNIVIVVMDCARAKSFGVDAGVARARTPVIDRLGRRGTVFPHAVAPANWTIPSHMSMFTGCYPNVHGLRTFRPGPPPRETLAAGLARRGYDTALFTEMVHLVAGYGLESGYARQFAAKFGLSDDDRTTSNRVASHLSVLYAPWVRTLIQKVPPTIVPLNFLNHPQEVAFKQEVCNGFVAHEFERWLGVRDPSKPFHAFFNVVDTHEPYPIIPNGHRLGPLAKWYARTPRYYLLAVPGLQDLVPWPELLAGYQWSVEQADAKVGRIVDALERSGELDRTLLIVTADHGQSFGEGGNVFHGCGATDSITRVPLVVSAPSGMSLPRTVERWTSLCDIFSWAKAAAAGRPAFGDDGRAPIPFSASAPPPETIFCEGAPASDPNRSLQGIGRRSSWNHRLLAAYRADGKYVLDLVTGAIAHWSPEVPDPDVVAPEVPTGREADEVRARVFGEYERIERARLVSAGPSETPTAELDGRLRSWGYD